ncbi:MAG: Uncharacterised protein [Prochlorococcus marinus str. MIT 9313]|nr:MAG: Uncharacterised protein [Prochlorococcus marinus str. MIT 9313]
MGEEDRQMAGFSTLLLKHGPKIFTFTVEKDDELNQQWRSLSKCPYGSISEAVLNHYQVHNFILPGKIGGANAALAHPSRAAESLEKDGGHSISQTSQSKLS